MFCEKCGKLNPDGISNCQGCGAPMSVTQPVSTPGNLNMGYQPSNQNSGMQGMNSQGMRNPSMGNPGMNSQGMRNPAMGNPGMNSQGMGNPGMGNPGGFGGFNPNTGGGGKFSSLTSGENKKKLILFGAIGVGIIVLVIILCLVMCGGNGAGSAEDVAIDYVEANLDYDIDAMLNTMPEAFEEGVKDSDEYEEILEATEKIADKMDINVESVEVIDTDVIKNTDSLEERINSAIKEVNSDAEKIKVEEAMTVTVEVTAEVMGRKSTEEIRVTTFKDEDTGDWYAWEPNM